MPSEQKSPEEWAKEIRLALGFLWAPGRDEAHADLIRSDRAASEEKWRAGADQVFRAERLNREQERLRLNEEIGAAWGRVNAAERRAEATEESLIGMELKHNIERDALRAERDDFKAAYQTVLATQVLLGNQKAELRTKLDKAMEAIVWMSGAADFSPGGPARAAFARMVLPLIDEALALRSDEPSALVSTGELAEIIRAGQEWAKSSAPKESQDDPFDVVAPCSGCGKTHSLAARMDAPGGPLCGCGQPSVYESGKCSACQPPASPSTPCEECGGEGYWEVDQSSPLGGHYTLPQDCPACSGTGRATSRETEATGGACGGDVSSSGRTPELQQLATAGAGNDGSSPSASAVSRPAEALSEAVVRRARDEIERLCAGPGRMTRDGGLAGRNWTMRVPAEPTDSDLVFSDLCDAHEVVLGEARALLTYRGRDRLALIEDFLQRTAAQGGGDV